MERPPQICTAAAADIYLFSVCFGCFNILYILSPFTVSVIFDNGHSLFINPYLYQKLPYLCPFFLHWHILRSANFTFKSARWGCIMSQFVLPYIFIGLFSNQKCNPDAATVWQILKTWLIDRLRTAFPTQGKSNFNFSRFFIYYLNIYLCSKISSRTRQVHSPLLVQHSNIFHCFNSFNLLKTFIWAQILILA